MNQFLSVLGASPPKTVANWLQHSTLLNQPYLDFDRDARPTVAADFAALSSDDFADDVRQCVAIAARAGLETLVVDQTRPDIGLPVVRVIVPGLRHFWGRFAPGRLYDVPVHMNWRSKPTPELELNPIIMFV